MHDPTQEGSYIHMGLAEQGKVHALEGEHRLALFYYRRAMHMSVQAGHPEVFFRHYLECVIESLEQMGAYEEVLAYCEQAIALYQDSPPETAVAKRDLAHIHQRMGVVKLKSGDPAGARAALERALAVIRDQDQRLPLAEGLLRWCQMGLHLDAQRITSEQRHHRYFSVRKDTVDPTRAIRLPDELLQRELRATAGG